MGGEIKMAMIRREIIKPASPTPNHLRQRGYNLSLPDQLASLVYVPILLFYPKIISIDDDEEHNYSEHLKKSLSEVLTRFYPIAGRLEGNMRIKCEDEGVDYVEARFHVHLSTYLQQRQQHDDDDDDAKLLERLLPSHQTSTDASSSSTAPDLPLLLVQASFFQCGGVALGIRMSHKFGDAATMSMFLKDWSVIALGATNQPLTALDYNNTLSTYFPPADHSTFQLQPSADANVNADADDKHRNTKIPVIKCVSKRFVFDGSSIAALKDKAATESVPQPTRLEVVTALIWKCAIAAVSARRRQSSTLSNSDDVNVPLLQHVLTHGVNLRKKISQPPFTEKYSIGNLVSFFAAKLTVHDHEEDKTELQDLINYLREGNKEFREIKAKRFQGHHPCQAFFQSAKEALDLILTKDDVNLLICSSWCNFGFYDVDFGWGKPTWVTNLAPSFKNLVTFMDTKEGDGIEAWVTLSEQEMELFQTDPELLAFASSNPALI